MQHKKYSTRMFDTQTSFIHIVHCWKHAFIGQKNQHITLPPLSMPLHFQQWRSRNIPSVLGVIILNEPSWKNRIWMTKSTLNTLTLGLLACLHVYTLSGTNMSQLLYWKLKNHIHHSIPKWMYAKLKVGTIKYERRVPTTRL